MSRSSKIVAILALLAVGFSNADDSTSFNAQAVADAFSLAVNEKDIDAVLSFWSVDAQLVFLPGHNGRVISGQSELRDLYENAFSAGPNGPMSIAVAGTHATEDQIREWGSYKIGQNVSGCYVILRRKSDDWKIHREWLFEPCGSDV